MTVAELFERMTAAEFDLWAAYYQRHGFDADRIETATAIAGAYVGAGWGGKAKPEQLVPRFGPPNPAAEFERLKAFFTRAAARQQKNPSG